MHESHILDLIDSITFSKLNDEEKSIVLAAIKDDEKTIKTANSIMDKLNGLYKGDYKIAENTKIFQDFSETSDYPNPMVIINKDEIDKFLDKMTSKTYKGDLFGDNYDFYHPAANMFADGLPKFRADFNQQQ
jgi:hypothetical protein